MGGRWYLRESTNAAVWGNTGPTGKQSGETDQNPSVPTGKNVCLAARAQKGSSEVVQQYSETVKADVRTMIRMFAGPPLAAQTIKDGATFDLAMAIKESSGWLNLYLAGFFYVWREGVGKVKELGADQVTDDYEANAGWKRWRKLTATNSGDYALADGDQIVCEVWANTQMLFGSSNDAMFAYDGSTDDYDDLGENVNVTDSASWMQCSQELVPADRALARGLGRGLNAGLS